MYELEIPQGEENRISEVTLFPAQGYVTRRAQAQVEEGMNRISLGLSAVNVDKESLQARVLGQGEIVAVQFQSTPAKEPAWDELRLLHDQQREHEREKSRLMAQLEGIGRRQKLLESVANFSSVQVPREIQTHLPDIQQLQQLLDYLQRNDQSLQESEQTIKTELEKLNREISLTQSRVDQLSQPEDLDQRSIELLFNAEQAQQITIDASYLVGRVAWQPLYKLDVPQELDGLSLTTLARIAQNSGEEWKDITLTLSNAQPASSNHLPEAFSRLLQPMPPTRVTPDEENYLTALPVGALSDVEEEPGIYPDSAVEVGGVANYATTQSTRVETAVEYRLSMPVSMESIERETLLPIEQQALTGDFFHYAVPRTDPLVYLVCRIQPDPDWQEGRINIHFGGRYVGWSVLRQGSAGDEMLLNLGPDRALKATHKSLSDKKLETFFGKVERSSVVRELHQRLTVENLRKERAKVHLLDSIPVATSDRHQVKEVTLSPTPTHKDWREREGVMLWELELEAREKRSVDLGYTIKYPTGEEPYGI